MTISVGSNSVSYQAYAGSAYSANSAANNASKGASAPDDTATGASSSASTSVTLSEEAKAYLARNATAQDDTPSVAMLTTNARAWFDQQYASLGISSAMLDGQVAVDLSQQTRATLSVVADNANGQFTPDEKAAAAKALQGRFNDALSPHVVIARHTGDYASLYKAASDYLDNAGAAEKANKTWQDQKQAVQDGLAAARVSFGKAPVTGNANDPVKALLAQASVGTTSATNSSDPGDLATRARAMLDAQAGSAKDNGKELVFSGGRKTGQQADFSGFDNRTLAVMALNSDASFSTAEASAAKAELNQRTRASLLDAFSPTSGGGAAGMTLGLLQQYSKMSAEEKSVLGFTDNYANKIVQNYRTMLSIQNNLGSGGGSRVPWWTKAG